MKERNNERRIILFSGTTEGRLLSEHLAEKRIAHLLSVATEYGEEVMHENALVQVRCGRLAAPEIRALIQEEALLVVDATHPYATEISRSLQEAARQTGVPYLRVLRKEKADAVHVQSPVASSKEDACIVPQDSWESFDSAAACADALVDTEGKILLTTGVKELLVFARRSQVRERLIVRVLPTEESIRLCREAGLFGNQILAMQGPFSTNLNRTVIRDKNIRILVTKESGATGGFPEKVEAAKEEGIRLMVIQRPEESGCTVDEALQRILAMQEETHAPSKKIRIDLVGTGPGSRNLLTGQALESIRKAELLFGAKRMVEVWPEKESYPCYRAEDILPVLQERRPGRVAILFSGDTGLFSGAKKTRSELAAFAEQRKLPIELHTCPGISSVSYLASKTGVPYAPTTVISLHGVAEEDPAWEKVGEELAGHKDVFVLLSGAKDIRRLGEKLIAKGLDCADITLGYQLSYPEESVTTIRPRECTGERPEGLYVALLQNREKNT